MLLVLEWGLGLLFFLFLDVISWSRSIYLVWVFISDSSVTWMVIMSFITMLLMMMMVMTVLTLMIRKILLSLFRLSRFIFVQLNNVRIRIAAVNTWWVTMSLIWGIVIWGWIYVSIFNRFTFTGAIILYNFPIAEHVLLSWIIGNSHWITISLIVSISIAVSIIISIIPIIILVLSVKFLPYSVKLLSLWIPILFKITFGIIMSSSTIAAVMIIRFMVLWNAKSLVRLSFQIIVSFLRWFLRNHNVCISF